MDLSNVYMVYQIRPHDAGLHYQPVGKFVLTSTHFEVLEDHEGFLEELSHQPPERIARAIHGLSHSSRFLLASIEEIRQGRHPELLQTHVAPPMPGPESRFEYHRVGMPQPQMLEFHQGKGYLDGHPLEEADLQLLLGNAQKGAASIRYAQEQQPIEKAEEYFDALTKAEEPIDPEVRKELTKDSLVRKLGNKKAYEEFLARPKQGVHIRMDANDFGLINQQHGYETGNQAIVALGGAIREAIQEAAGKDGQAFRVGGDEFHAFVPTHDHAALFARAVRSKLEAIPSPGLSLSIGFGHTPEHAELAMINAKAAKNQSGAQPGSAKSHAASQVPGFEGSIPTGGDQLQLQPIAQMHPVTATDAIAHLKPPEPTVASPGPYVPSKP